MTLRLTLICLLLAASAGAHPMLRDEPPADGVPAVGVDSLAWMAGRWSGDALGGTADEVWAPPLGGQMVGAFRAVKDGQVQFYELITLLVVEGRLNVRLKHFSDELHGWEQPAETVDFPLNDHADGVWYFAGMTIARVDDDHMTVYVRVADDQVLDFPYERSP